MRPTVSQYATALTALSLEEGGGKEALFAKNIVAWLKRRGEDKKLPAIVAYLEKLAAVKAGTLTVKATVARTLSEESKQHLTEKAQALFPGKQITLHYVIDEHVIGGAKLSTEETLYDGTLANELAALKKFIQ